MKQNPIVLFALLAVVGVVAWSIVPGWSADAVSGVPNWAPLYPRSRVTDVATRNTGVETYTQFRLEVPADCEKVIAWYDEKLKLAGFDVSKSISRTPFCSGIMRAEGPGHTRGLHLNGGADKGGGSWFAVTAVVRDLPGQPSAGGTGQVPAWVPQYPNSKPANVVAKQEGLERSVAFNFATGDDAKTVIGWYERKLKEAHFTIVSSTVFDSSTAKLAANDASGRSILTIRMEPAGSRKVVAIEAREGVQ